MKKLSIRALVSAIVISLILTITGCARAPEVESTPSEKRNMPAPQGGEKAESKEGSDDMDRLD